MANEHERLSVLVGRWRTEGWTEATAEAPATKIEAVDTYEWLPGRYSVLHRVDARVGDERVKGAEIIGWDPGRNAFVTQYFGSDGPSAYEAGLAEEDGALVWSMHSRSDRFMGTFSHDRNRLTGGWDRLDEEERWRPWMEVSLTKETS
jgi:hypothetical protein